MTPHTLTDDGWQHVPIPTGDCYLHTDAYERTDRIKLITITNQYHGGCSLITVSYADTDWTDGTVTIYRETDSGGTDARSRAEAVAWELGSHLGSLYSYKFNPEYRGVNEDDQ